MAELTIKSQIKRLVDLQKIDSQIYELKEDLKQKPAVIEDLKTQFEESKQKLKVFEDKLKAVQLDRKAKELDLKAREDDIIKANGQLLQLKTNKEYTAKLSEIESIKADKSILEEKILMFFDDGDVIQKEIDAERKVLAEREKEFLTKKKETEDSIKLLEDRSKVLESQRKQYLSEIDLNNLKRYEKILSHKNGIAIVAIHNNKCGGCHMNITQQMVNAIKMHDTMVECEICSRILYLEDDL